MCLGWEADGDAPAPPQALHRPLISREWPHWLALARMVPFFARKSHAATVFAGNIMIFGDYSTACDIFDSHRPLHFSLAHIGLGCPRLGARTFLCSHSMDASSSSRRLSPRKLLHSELPGIGHGAANLVTKVANADFCA